MNKKLVAKFKNILLESQKKIFDDLQLLQGSSAQQLEQGVGDEVDIASTEITQAAIQKLGTRQQKHLQKIDYALKKIEAGEYGICEECGEEIAPARLEARPEALFCIDCKTLQEQRERQYVDEDEREEESWDSMEGDEAGE